MKTNTIEFFRAAMIRALRTGAQSVLSLITIGVGVFDVDWKTVISVSLMAMLVSFLTSIVTGLPEANTSGAFVIDDNDASTTQWRLYYDGDPTELKPGDTVRFKVMQADQNGGGVEVDEWK